MRLLHSAFRTTKRCGLYSSATLRAIRRTATGQLIMPISLASPVSDEPVHAGHIRMDNNPGAQRRPAFMWYPGDSRRDTGIQSCSLEARGFWRELLDLMHFGEPYGHLADAGGGRFTETELARLVGVPPQKARRLIAELRAKNVFSETGNGVIYSRRMVRDEAVRAKRAEGGAKSLENPNVPRPKSDRPVAGEAMRTVTGKGYPSNRPSHRSSSGSSRPSPAVADTVAVARNHKSGKAGTDSPLFEEFRKRFYGNDDTRWADVKSQLTKAIRGGCPFEGRLILASPAKLDAALSAVLATPPRDPDMAIVFVLKKLSDAKVNDRGRTITEAMSAQARRDENLELQYAQERKEQANRWTEANPLAAKEVRVRAEKAVSTKPGEPGYQVEYEARLNQALADEAGIPQYEEWLESRDQIHFETVR